MGDGSLASTALTAGTSRSDRVSASVREAWAPSTPSTGSLETRLEFKRPSGRRDITTCPRDGAIGPCDDAEVGVYDGFEDVPLQTDW